MFEKKSYQDLIILLSFGCLLVFLASVTTVIFSAFIFYLLSAACFYLLYQPRKSKTAGRVLILMCLAMVILTLTEFAALLHYKWYVLNSPENPRYNHDRIKYWKENRELGHIPPEGVLIRAVKSSENEILYNVEYTFNQDGWRNTKGSSLAECSMAFFGGSAMFGEGLPDLHTLPSQFSEKLNYHYNVLNFGFHDYGPHHMLRILELDIPEKMIKDRMSVTFYLLSDSDIKRATGMHKWPKTGPKYILDNDSVKYAGSFGGPAAWLNLYHQEESFIMNLLEMSRLFYLILNSQELSRNNTNRKILLVSGIIRNAAKIISDKYESQLIVLYKEAGSPATRRIINKLSLAGIKTFSLSELIKREWSKDFQIPGTNLPNKTANNEIATALANNFGEC